MRRNEIKAASKAAAKREARFLRVAAVAMITWLAAIWVGGGNVF